MQRFDADLRICCWRKHAPARGCAWRPAEDEID
jgi:hypothetical protein